MCIAIFFAMQLKVGFLYLKLCYRVYIYETILHGLEVDQRLKKSSVFPSFCVSLTLSLIINTF